MYARFSTSDVAQLVAGDQQAAAVRLHLRIAVGEFVDDVLDP